jgi:hypothetical protein
VNKRAVGCAERSEAHADRILDAKWRGAAAVAMRTFARAFFIKTFSFGALL